eukprot:2371150-Alexandrium_andersonii.AAC.1
MQAHRHAGTQACRHTGTHVGWSWSGIDVHLARPRQCHARKFNPRLCVHVCAVSMSERQETTKCNDKPH